MKRDPVMVLIYAVAIGIPATLITVGLLQSLIWSAFG